MSMTNKKHEERCCEECSPRSGYCLSLYTSDLSLITYEFDISKTRRCYFEHCREIQSYVLCARLELLKVKRKACFFKTASQY